MTFSRPRLPEAATTPTPTTHGIARFMLYAGLGALVGLIVVALEWVSVEMLLHRLVDAPRWLRVVAPAAGVCVVSAVLFLAGRTDPGTSDLYVKTFHGTATLGRRPFLPKLAGAIGTVGSGAAVGLEGPAIYAGSSVGAWLGRLPLRVLGNRAHRVLLAAGAAAGVAAVFKAPATGVLFALEAPYKRDIARQALIPALVASAAAYTAFVLVLGADRLLPIGAAPVSLTHEILGAVVLGVIAGIAARGTAALFHRAKTLSHQPAKRRLPVAALLLLGCGAAGAALVDQTIMLGPGAEAAVEIVLDPSISLWVILALFVLRATATSAALGAGAVGGVFIPLVVQGLLLGRLIEVFFESPAEGLFPVVGLAAMLGAGYRTPLAAVMFVAETTGRSEFVIPALLATAISQSLMGEGSVSSGQLDERKGRLERRFELPAIDVADPAPPVATANESLLDIVDRLAGDREATVVAVLDDGYEGMLVLTDVAVAVFEHGPDAEAARILRRIPAVSQDEPARAVAAIMSEHNTAAVVVLDADGLPAGLVTAASLSGLTLPD